MDSSINIFCKAYERDLKILKESYLKIKELETKEMAENVAYQKQISRLSDSINRLEKMIFDFKNG